jgi:hypothetical protein
MERNGSEFKSRDDYDEIVVQEYPGATHTAVTALRMYKQVELMADHDLCDYVEMA